MDTLAQVVAVTGVVLFLGVPSVVCWLKGKRWWATIGFFSGWHWVPVFRLAKPGSWWANRYYDAEKNDRAETRFRRSPQPVASEVLEEFDEHTIGLEDRTTRRAWSKAQRATRGT